MANTETFYVSTVNNKVKPVTDNPQSYFDRSWESKNYGKAKYCIEVFGSNHQKVAETIRDIIEEKGLSKKLFHIMVETR